MENYYPSYCIHCGHRLSGEDPQPLRIQIVEIPPLKPIVNEHRFHARVCDCCGQGTRAVVEEIVNGRRPAVLWRKSSFGSQSATGSLFVSRMLTVVTSLRLQQRHVLDFLTQACRAKRLQQPTPSLLPTTLNFDNVVAPAA